MNSIVNQLASMKIVFDDEFQDLMFLSSLPENWETLVVAVSSSVLDGVVSMSQVTSSLLNEEKRRKSTGSIRRHLLLNQEGYRSRSTTSHNRDQSRESLRGRSPSKKDIECYYCKKKGHMKRECLKLKFKEENRAKYGEKKQEITTVVSSDADFFTSYNEGDSGCVRMGNEGLSKFFGMGNICLETSVGCKLVLKDVRHVPNIRLNLISTGKLDDESYHNHFDFDKDDQPEEIAIDLVDLEPTPSPSTHVENEEDVQPPLEVGENVDGEPESYQETMGHDKKDEWAKAMQEEMKSLLENRTYDLLKLPKGGATNSRTTTATGVEEIHYRQAAVYSPDEFVTVTEQGEPESYQETMEHDKKDEWAKAMQVEIRSLLENHTYDLVKLPKEGNSIAEYLNEMNSIVNQLGSMKIVFDDELQALMFLSSLLENWKTLVMTVSNSVPDGVVSMSQDTSSLLNEVTRRKSTDSSHLEPLVVKPKGRSRGVDVVDVVVVPAGVWVFIILLLRVFAVNGVFTPFKYCFKFDIRAEKKAAPVKTAEDVYGKSDDDVTRRKSLVLGGGLSGKTGSRYLYLPIGLPRRLRVFRPDCEPFETGASL
ncbi:hypothetical protein RHSIM_Rhsim11G0033800 [Rhododendron simsii]|uniref:CCHC-type domain-containing protein n=1 Tax=Rhododendron simsii TaxID=118357 RepID=A0A834G717_RHOSS|nr:hypothetical protein RHSIM_Rhsim11G0033800 [Rhododendron simsii]